MKLSEKMWEAYKIGGTGWGCDEIKEWMGEVEQLEARIKALEANASKSVLRRLDAQLKESDV